jgi:hypothetical protein
MWLAILLAWRPGPPALFVRTAIASVTAVERSGTAATVTKVCVLELGRKSAEKFSGWVVVGLDVL